MKRTPLRPGTKPLRRRTRLKPVNAARRERLRLQQFGGQHRDRIVALPCAACGAPAPSDPAHTRARGMGGVKGRWYDIVPLCRTCHREHDEYRGRLSDPEVRAVLVRMAYRLAWESWDAGDAPEKPPVPRPET